jgi:hypothetical protein
MPPPAVAGMRKSPFGPALEALAHTLTYDVRITIRGSLQIERAPSVQSQTFVIYGDASPPWMRDASRTLASAVPNGRQRALEGQTHDVDIKTLARALDELFVG